MAESTNDQMSLLSRVPVVLVVGDFRSRDAFVWNAWQRIWATYSEGAESMPITLRDPTQALSEDPATLIEKLNEDGPRASKLYPVPFSDMGNMMQPGVHKLLTSYLCSLNIVSIVACGTARNTRSLLTLLEPLLTPVMIVVDSTLKECSCATPRVYTYGGSLRLVPGNDLQAQALVGRVVTLAERHSRNNIQIFSWGSNEYVLDLSRVLEEQWQYGAGRLAARFASSVESLDSDPNRGILVCIGYFEAFQKLLNSGKRWRYIVLTDGCLSEQVRTMAAADSETEYYLARPTSLHADYACDAYTAINVAWEHSHGVKRQDAIEICDFREPFRALVGAALEGLWPSRYRFRGHENQRGGYLVERLEPRPKRSRRRKASAAAP